MRLGIPGSIASFTAMPKADRAAYSVGEISNCTTFTAAGGNGLAIVHMLQQVFEA